MKITLVKRLGNSSVQGARTFIDGHEVHVSNLSMSASVESRAWAVSITFPNVELTVIEMEDPKEYVG